MSTERATEAAMDATLAALDNDHSASRAVDVLAEEAPHLIAADGRAPHVIAAGERNYAHNIILLPGQSARITLRDSLSHEEVGETTISWQTPDLPHDLQIVTARLDEATVGMVRSSVI